MVTTQNAIRRCIDHFLDYLDPPVRARLLARLRSHPTIRDVEGRFIAERDAASSRKLDICAADLANALQASDIRSIHDSVCLEVGSGRVLTYSIVLHLLGAQKVFSTDIVPLAQPAVLSTAIGEASESVVCDLLSPFENRSRIHARLERLRRVKRFDFKILADLGVEYKAPLDLAKERMGTSIDFVYSMSVLEHIPREDLGPILQHLAEDLAPGGKMIHHIHLEDHKNLATDPFRFFQEPAAVFTREVQTARGNRIRRSEWEEIFSGVDGTNSRFFRERTRNDCALPQKIDASIRFVDEHDLRVSELDILITRKT